MRWLGAAAVCITGCLSVPPAGDSDDSGETTSTSGATSTTSPTTSTSATTGSSSDGTQGPATTTTGIDDTGGSTGGSGSLDVDGEIIDVPDGWDGGVWFDFSESYVFDANAYPDDEFVFNNAPQSMFILRAPFAPGLGVITVHTIIELLDTGDFAERNFFRATGSTGPDAMNQAVDCRGFEGLGDVYCVGAGSQNAGDGLFTVDSNWNIELLATINNTNEVGFDPQGVFSGSGAPTLYYGTPDGLFEYPDTEIVPLSSQPRRVTDDGQLAAILNEPAVERLVTIAPVSYEITVLRTETKPAEPIARQNAGALSIVTGDTSQLPASLFAAVQGSELWAFPSNGPSMILARSDPSQGWRWASIVVPESSHPLARDGRPTFYILEANRDADIDRVIWSRPPEP